ncbi:c-type cytochrome [Thiohalorhabdus sp.]|uniref:c-type cytochrome n=1 Tax=Thiohalorhabdus sp. TaxID=3094134 RepID=UPI002FC29B5F
MNVAHKALLLTLPLALLGLVACDSGEQASQQAPEKKAAPAEESTSANQPEKTTAKAEGDEEPAASGDNGQVAESEPEPESEPSEPTTVAASDNGKKAAQDLGCTACHTATTQLVGPSYQAVAQRYNGDKAKIAERMKMAVEDGASGNWSDVTGGTPMPAQPQAADKPDQLDAIAGWIAGMGD